MRLQVAIDTPLKEGLRIAKNVLPYVDIIEIGTPLLKERGLSSVRQFKKFNKKIFLDMKTMDTGFYEASLGFKAGADIVSVCAAAKNETIEGAIKAGRKYKREVLVDLIGIQEVSKRSKEIFKMKPDYICVHTGIDSQKKGKDPIKDLKRIAKISNKCKVAVAGGINKGNILEVLKQNPEIIIIGGAITRSSNPQKAAKELRRAILND